MSRFGPGVTPIARTGLLEALARGANVGLDEYDVTRDRTRRERFENEDRTTRAEDRRRAISRQSDADAIAGITDAPAAPPVGPPVDENDQLAAALTAGAGPRSSSGVPGGFDAFTGAFETPAPRLAPRRLPSGRMYDPQSVADREMALALQEAENAERGRGFARNRRMRQLAPLRNDPQYDELMSDEQMVAASESDALTDYFIRRGTTMMPPRGTEEYLEMLEAESAARGKGSARGRGTTGGAPTINAQITAAERELARAIAEQQRLERGAPKRNDETYGGMAAMIPGREGMVPLDETVDARFRSDSTAHAGRVRGAASTRSTAAGRLDALRRSRGDNRPISQGGGQPIDAPNVRAEMDREIAAIDSRLARLKANPRATPEIIARAEAAARQDKEAIAARYRE